MKIAVACDHGGLNLKKALLAFLEKNGRKPLQAENAREES